MNFSYQKVHVLILPISKVYMILLHSYYIFLGPGGKATFHFHYFENYCLSKSKYKIEIHIFWQRYVLLWKLRMAAVHRTRNLWWITARRHANYVVIMIILCMAHLGLILLILIWYTIQCSVPYLYQNCCLMLFWCKMQ